MATKTWWWSPCTILSHKVDHGKSVVIKNSKKEEKKIHGSQFGWTKWRNSGCTLQTTRLKTISCQHPHTLVRSRARFPAGGKQVWFMMGPPLFIIFTSSSCSITALQCPSGHSWGASMLCKLTLYQVNQGCRCTVATGNEHHYSVFKK